VTGVTNVLSGAVASGTTLSSGFATFAVGFLARPLGGLIFGHFGDRIGRKSVLLMTLLIMGTATSLVGFLPTFETAGIWATTALLVLRFLQGIALGGEATAAGLMAIETAPDDQRGFSAAVIQAAGPLGVVLASLAVMMISRLPEGDFLSWGWRVPFIVSGILVALGVYVRLRIEESATFEAARRQGDSVAIPALEAIRRHPGSIIAVLFAEMAQSSYYYLTAIFTLSFATRQLGVSKEVMIQAVLLANVVSAIAMPTIGAWSDRIGRKRLFLAGVALAALSILVYYHVLATRETWMVTGAVIIAAGLIHPLMFSTEGSYFPELFPTRIRFSGVSIGKQLGTVLGGGLAPLIATALYAAFGTTLAITGYYLALALGAGVALCFMRDTRYERLSD
jgi:MFS family permease